MAEMLPSNYIIGIVMFTLFIVGGVALLAEQSSVNPDMLTNDKFERFNKTFDVMGDVTEEVDDIEDSIKNSDADQGLFGVLNSLINSAWNTLSLIFDSFSFMDGVWQGTNKIFGIPVWVATLISGLVTILFAFAIWSAVFQRKL